MPAERIKTRWPRLMSEADAAEYLGVSVSQFRREVERGMWPKRKHRGDARINTYDRKALDDAVDHLDNLINHPPADEVDLDREFGIGGNSGPLSRNSPSR